MEIFFVRILNSALLVCALVCLLIVGAAVLLLGGNVDRAFFADTSNQHISIPYQPANLISAEGSTPAIGGKAEDTAIIKAARLSCDASNALIEFVSKNQFSLADGDKCPAKQSDAIFSQYGDRSENYLTERASYIHALLGDSQAGAIFNIPAGADISAETDKYLDKVDAEFDDRFRSATTADDARKTRELNSSLEGKAAMVALGGVAATAFFAFLIVAFLLVAVRLEKHIGNIEAKISRP